MDDSVTLGELDNTSGLVLKVESDILGLTFDWFG